MRRTLLLLLAIVALSDLYAQTRLGLHFTKEELEIWRKRAVNGPYRIKGDAQSNSPGDWTRIVSSADAFVAKPTSERWVGYTGTGCFPSNATYEPGTKGGAIQCAAFSWLVTGNEKYVGPVKDELLWHAQQPSLDFTNSSRWCYFGDSNPGFNISEWATKLLFAYDYTKERFTPAERAILDKWFLGMGKFFATNIDQYYSKRFVDRLNGDYRLTSYSLGAEKSDYTQLMYFGSTPVGFLGRGYNNRNGTNARFIGTVGVFLNNIELQTCAKRWFFEWMRYGVYPSMDIADLHRSLVNPSTEPERGLFYVYSLAQAMSDLADIFARSGDKSLYEYATTEGYHGSESPGNPKNLRKVLENTLMYMNGTHQRYASETPTSHFNLLINGIDPYSSPNEITYDTWFCVANRYYKSEVITSNYLRQAPGCRPYPSNARNIGPNQPWGGHAGIYPGTLFMFGQLEGITDPYTEGSPTLPGKPLITVTGSLNLCQGESVILSAPANQAGYQWSTGETTRQITVSTAGSYRIRVKDQHNNYSPESDAVSVRVTTVTQPVITSLGSTTICRGERVALRAGTGEGLTYQWKRNDVIIPTATTASYTATEAGKYTVVATHNDCISTSSAPVTVVITNLPKPVITADGNPQFNEGESVVLSISQATGYAYQWRLNGVLIAQAVDYRYTATQAGSYTVQIEQNSCASEESAPFSVTVHNARQSQVTPDGSVNFCQGGSVLLKSTTGTDLTYEWLRNGIKIPAVQTSTYSASESGNYTVIVSRSGIPLLPSNPITVTVTPLIVPIITAKGPTAFCSNGAVTLEANRGTGLTYQWKKDGNVIPNATSSDYRVTSTGTYSVEITQSGCQTSTSNTIRVDQTATPIIVVNGSTTFCEGGSVVLSTATGDHLVYQWKRNGVILTGATQAEYTASERGSYTVETKRNNCTSLTSEPVNVTINNNLVPVISSPGGTLFCDGTTLLLQASVGAGITYQWKKNGINIPSAISANLEVSQPGVYNVMVTGNGCGSVLSNAVTITKSTVPLPNAIVTVQGSTNICAGTSVTLTANTGPGLSYQWQKNGEPIVDATNPTYAARATGNYSVKITMDGCRVKVSNEITVSIARLATKPTITASSNTISGDGGVTLSSAAVNGLSYQWLRNNIHIPNATSPTYQATQAGSYALAVTQNNCQQAISDPILISIITPHPNGPVISISGPATFCEGGSVRLTAPGGYLEYYWSNGATTQSITVTQTGDYSVLVKQGNSSSSLASRPVRIEVIPQPAQPVIRKVRQKLVAERGYGYQWLLSGQPIVGANGPEYIPTQEGRYAVVVTNERGCASLSKEVPYSLSNPSTKIAFQGEEPVLYPNPNTGKFTLAFPAEATQQANDSLLNVTVVNSYGQIVHQESLEVSIDTQSSFDLSFLPIGVYLLRIERGNQVYTKRLMKE